MEITWIGHSSFLMKDSKGKILLTDPFDDTVGYGVYNGHADIVTISHPHFDHNCIAHIKGSPKIIEQVGNFTVEGISIYGLPCYHDKIKGAKRGENIIFVFEMDGYRFCHLGDLGHLLSPDDLDKIGKIDVLLIPVGGNFTISGKEATEIAKAIHSHIVIPMHYKTSAISFPLQGVENFITHMKNGQRLHSATLTLTDTLTEVNEVKILDFFRTSTY